MWVIALFIECFNNNGRDYLRVVQAYAYKDGDVSKRRRRVVRNVGPLSRFDDGQPEYLARLRQSFKDGAPIIPSLSDLVQDIAPNKRISITFNPDNAADCFFSPKNLGYMILDALYDALGIYDVCNSYKSRRGLNFDLNGTAKLLIFGRALFPDSKYATFENRDRFVFPVTKSESVNDVYYTLDALNEKAETIQKRMNLKIRNSIGRNTEVCFYDVTNYYFEIGENDPDGGLRKKGVSKEKRGEPIVQMGLFIDDNGIPIAYKLFPGNNTDATTLRPAMKKTIDNMDFGRVIIVADGGLNSGPNIAHILNGGNGYIVSKSTKKSDKTTKAWILDESGYIWNDAGTFKVKSQIRTRKIKDEDGNPQEIKEKIVCYWSKRHYERERHENKKFIEYLDSVIANPDKLKDKQSKVAKFLKKTEADKATGEVVKTVTSLSLDFDKIQEYIALMGYYTIMTSEIDKLDEEIISKYHGLSRIEDSFRITKSDLEGRPVFVRTPEHINAHFLTCFIALTMFRLIQYKILKHRGEVTDSAEKWESGLSAKRIQKALNAWQAESLPDGYFRTTEPSNDMRLVLDSIGIEADLRFPIAPEIRKLKLDIDMAFM